jgi:hypothetical protein
MLPISEKEALAGFSLSLIENAVIEVYHLRKDGTLFAELGTELGPPGGYAGTWTIEKGRLVLADRKNTTEVFELIEQIGTSQVKVRRRNGDIAFFRVSPTNE